MWLSAGRKTAQRVKMSQIYTERRLRGTPSLARHEESRREEECFRRFDNQAHYQSFEECVKDLKVHYRRTHPRETEGLHYQFVITCSPDGKSGFVKVNRLETPPEGTNAPTETLLIEDNRVRWAQPKRWAIRIFLVAVTTAKSSHNLPPFGRTSLLRFRGRHYSSTARDSHSSSEPHGSGIGTSV